MVVQVVNFYCKLFVIFADTGGRIFRDKLGECFIHKSEILAHLA
jgi:hypothetical protein